MNGQPRYTRALPNASPGRSGGFTLIELLVVIVIILLISAVTLPTIIPALGNRQMSEAARILQGALAGARDAAIRANAPRGIRLLPDPVLSTSLGAGGVGVLVYSRIIPIEPAPDYSEGRVQIVGDDFINAGTPYTAHPWYSPQSSPSSNLQSYPPGPYSPANNPRPAYIGKVLRLEESRFRVDTSTGTALTVPNPPTNWWWNVRVGDKVRVGDAGRYYTVVGPLTTNPTTPDKKGNLGQNSEFYVNNSDPQTGVSTRLLRDYPGLPSTPVEFLYLVNGQDDDGDGYIDNGWDGLDNDFALGISRDRGVDDAFLYQNTLGTNVFGEWETEVWLGSLSKYNPANTGIGYILTPASPPFPLQLTAGDLSYSVRRRPVVSPGARESALPGSVVIDATTWNTSHERSRLPVDFNNHTVDILVDQAGQVVSTSGYSSSSTYDLTYSFYHFWLTDRSDVFDPGTFTNYPTLPVTSDLQNSMQQLIANSKGTNNPINPILGTQVLKKDRALVTLYAKSGLIVTTSIEQFDPNLTDSNVPYRDAQLGIRESK